MKKAGITRLNAGDMVSKAYAIMEHSRKEMLQVEYNTQLLEAAFIELKKHPDGSSVRKAHSAVIRCVADSIIIALHAACFDKTRAKRVRLSLTRIMRGKKASFCDAVSLVDGQQRLSKSAANIITKQRVLLGAKWKGWKPYICFKEGDLEKEQPFPVFPNEDPIPQRIDSQKRRQSESLNDWKKIGASAAFKRLKATRDQLKAHHSMAAFTKEEIATFADVIEVSKKCTDAMSAIYMSHFGRRLSANSDEGRSAYESLANPICKSCGKPAT